MVKLRAIAGVVLLVFALIFIGIRNGSLEIDTTDYNVTFEWQTNDLFAYLPEPDTNYGRIVRESEKQINFELYQINQVQFESYIKACREKGFSIDVTKTDSVFYADNMEGLNLNVFYDDDKKIMNIYLDSYSVEETSTPTTEPIPTIGFEEGSYFDLDVEHYTFSVPNYWNEEGSKEEYLQYYAETDGKVAMLSIGYPVDDKDEVSFELLVDDNENMIKAIESMYKNCKVIEHQEFSSDYGINGIVYDFTFTYREFLSKYDMNGKFYCFPSPEDNRWFYVVVGVTDNTDRESADYFNDYVTMLASIRDSE